MLAVVVAEVTGEGEYQFERCKFGSNPEQLQRLAEWLVQQEVQEAALESTAQYGSKAVTASPRLAARVASAGTKLETGVSAAGRRWGHVRYAASGAGEIQSRTTWTQE